MNILYSVLILTVFTASSVVHSQPQKSISQRNFKGQKYLFDQGWYVIPSGSKAWSHFKEKSLASSSNAMSKAVKDIKKSKFKMMAFDEYVKSAQKFNASFSSGADNTEKKLDELAGRVDQGGKRISKNLIKKSYDRLVIGYVSFEKRTQEESKRLKSFWANYITDYKKSKKNLDKGFSSLEKKFYSDMEVAWGKHFKTAGSEFEKQYKKSGSRGNSISALWDILVGYGKGLYHAIIKPGAEESKNVIKKSAFFITKGVFHTFMFAGSVVYSTGANLYHATKYGYKIVSPTIESGLLASLSIITLTASQGSKYTLKGTGVISKYALEGMGKVGAAGKFVVHTAYDATKDAAYTILRLGAGTGEAVLETTQGVVVLGYTALTQLPVQALLGAVNSTVFLIYDGPKIIIAKIKGSEFKAMPAGTVLDKRKLQEAGYEIEEIEVDDIVKKKILESSK